MIGKGEKSSPVIMSRWTFDHLPTELHRAVAAEMLANGRLVIVPDSGNVGSYYINGYCRGTVEAA